ncbi:MBL fold metallo-hydrolase [Streptomyces sp. NBC_01362]|uniref:MBL fold metallo-hydrolase n=1 Tax=Streptomyces sp. NBC_01362 TaxID=2903839 RepID=UPI003FCD1563
MFRFRIGQAYLWRDGADLALIDAGDIDAAPAIEGAVRGPGLDPARIGRIVIAHGHCDHYGAAQELADRHGAEILAHGPDAAVIRGEEAVAPRVPHRDPSSRHGVLFTGDTVARVDRMIPGVLNIDRAQTVASFRRPAALEPATVCFGHGEPLTADSAALMRASADRYARLQIEHG